MVQAADSRVTSATGAHLQGGALPARDVLFSIKAANEQLHDKTVRKGVFYGFGNGKQPLSLLDVEAKLAANEPVQLTVVKYEKASGWLIGAAMCLGGSWPVLEGANLKQMRFALKRELTSTDDLLRAFEDAKLA
jgi:hypothetical protein